MSETTDLPFDLTAIEKLRKVAGDQAPAFVAEMAALFLEEAAKQVAELRRAHGAKDWKMVSRTAHSLKSSAATLGLMQLSSTCRELELRAKSGEAPADTGALVALAASQYEASVPVLKSLA
jgi:HPt (histidine-containing phosphotransfer) domain-containing protein